MKFIFSILAASLCICKSANALTIIPAPDNGAAQMGRSIGEGFGKGFDQGMQMALSRKQRERERQKIQEEQAQYIAREKAILEEILKDYDFSNHSKCILKVLQSELSKETKEITVNVLNEQYKLYLQEKKK